MSTVIEMSLAPSWQAALALAPAAVCALGAACASPSDSAAAWRLARRASSLSLSFAIASLVALVFAGSAQAYGLRADPVGGVLSVLVTFVGWIIVRYSGTYLAGERGETGYVRWLLATLAAVLVVAVSNHLLALAMAWAAASLSLHRLLTFFPDRPAAVNAAHKKFVLGRAAEVAMLGACALLATEFGTLRIDALVAQVAAAHAASAGTQVAAVLVALAALLKCAQLPFHGWLIQVMEAPTPVSALLHAGVVNLGGFVLIRLAPLVGQVPAASGLLVLAGVSTAVLAALVMTTRISIKVALAWSTCAQMGFMLMQCGLGLWEMALLHLVAHSLYKAHAFLGAGGVVRRTLVQRLAPVAPTPGVLSTVASGAGALAMTAACAYAFGLHPDAHPALLVMGAVFALALTPMVRPSPSGIGGWTWLRACAAAFLLACIYFGLHAALQGALGVRSLAPGTYVWMSVASAFALLFALQCMVAARPNGALATRLYPWFYGGLFLDERFSRALFRLWPPPRPALPARA